MSIGQREENHEERRLKFVQTADHVSNEFRLPDHEREKMQIQNKISATLTGKTSLKGETEVRKQRLRGREGERATEEEWGGGLGVSDSKSFIFLTFFA